MTIELSENVIEAIADAVVKKMQQTRNCKTCKHSDGGNCAYTEECHECMWGSKYEQQPKTGHWKLVQRGKYIDICCSKCGFQRIKEYAYNYTVDQISEQDVKDFFSNSNMNFCENCGAKMESEDKE